MKYAVKEIYYTLQGEGINVGRPAVFLRFAGCNLWSGREADRHDGRVPVLRYRLRRHRRAWWWFVCHGGDSCCRGRVRVALERLPGRPTAGCLHGW